MYIHVSTYEKELTCKKIFKELLLDIEIKYSEF